MPDAASVKPRCPSTRPAAYPGTVTLESSSLLATPTKATVRRGAGYLGAVDAPGRVECRAVGSALVDDVCGEGDDVSGLGPARVILCAGAQEGDAGLAGHMPGVVNAVRLVEGAAVDESGVEVDTLWWRKLGPWWGGFGRSLGAATG